MPSATAIVTPASEIESSAHAGPRAFASRAGLEHSELSRAPLRWPRPSLLERELESKPGKLSDGLASLGLHTVADLLEHLPRDRREARTVATLRAGEQATIAVEVRTITARAVRRRGMRPLVEAQVFDETGTMRATFFNQPWLVGKYPPGTRLLLHGKASAAGRFQVAHHATGEDLGAEPASSGAVSHYPASEGVTSTHILMLVHGARAAFAEVVEPLPARLLSREGLPDRSTALTALHFPASPEEAEAGRRRLAFEELLLAQLVFLRRRLLRDARAEAPALNEPPSLSERWREHALPFALTADQQAACAAIAADLAQPQAMQRLLMGEVGSGKTVVALYALLRAVEHGHQGALMAPTETLAEQHFATVQRLIGSEPVSIALLTGSTPARRRADVLGKLSSGELSLVVGTHALIEPDVRFRSLAVAVIDEQHRFGVRQRAALDGGGGRAGAQAAGAHTPHTLHMTATPIPRTLALAGYGDLDVSALHELPAGRRPIHTRIVTGEEARAQAYEQLREELRAGRQAFVVCPLVESAEESDQATQGAGGELRAATAEFQRLSHGELEGFRLTLLHGQMPTREKQAAMARFASGESDVLVATTVIEVGIDVPRATVMLVENAERFGISQLHQLRGRIGRGEHASSCLLMGASASVRLRALAEHSDGFRLAEIDLRLRKEGELIGTRQSGIGQFRVASLPSDAALLERARSWARQIVDSDPELCAPEHALLADALREAFGGEALEPIPA